jgi:quinol monooxygenase YgiN
MFARVVSLQVKPNASSEFARVFEKKIIPALHQQHGFAGEMLFVDPGGPEVVAISLWKSRGDAETHERRGYPDLLNALAALIERPPAVRTLKLAHSTLHPPGAAEFPNQSPNTTPPGSPGA